MTTPQKNIRQRDAGHRLRTLVTVAGVWFLRNDKTGAIFWELLPFCIRAMLGWLLCRLCLHRSHRSVEGFDRAAPVKTEKQASEPVPAGSD